MQVSEDVFSKVQIALVDALGVDEDEVTPEATMVGDLGAESIDFLDMVFRLERAFKTLKGKAALPISTLPKRSKKFAVPL